KFWNLRGATNFLPPSVPPSLPIEMIPHCVCRPSARDRNCPKTQHGHIPFFDRKQ
ncbi:hypothetical protein NDU88_009996, partial [Pleurodeles waltl]